MDRERDHETHRVDGPGAEAGSRYRDADSDRDVDVHREPDAQRETDVRRETAVRRDADVERDERVSRRDPDAGLAAARERFGGLDIPATLVGALTALAVLLLLGGLVSAAIGAIGYQTGLEEGASVKEISIAGLIGGLLLLFLAFWIGGWAAGRMARYDGAKNGLLVGIWVLLLAALLAALGAWLGSEYNILQRAELPNWFSGEAMTVGGILSGLVAIAVMLVAGVLGGIWGARYHKRADREILAPRTT